MRVPSKSNNASLYPAVSYSPRQKLGRREVTLTSLMICYASLLLFRRVLRAPILLLPRSLSLIKDGRMLPFCKETYDFVSACEKLQFKLMDGGTLTAEERAIIEDSAIGLLGKMKARRQ